MTALDLPPKVSLHATCPAGWAVLQYDKIEGTVAVRGSIVGLPFSSEDQIPASTVAPAVMSLLPFIQKVLQRFEATEDSGDGLDVHLSGVIDGENIRTQTVRVPLRVGPFQQLTAFNSAIEALRKKMKKS